MSQPFKLSPEREAALVVDYQNGVTIKALIATYGVSAPTIYRIVKVARSGPQFQRARPTPKAEQYDRIKRVPETQCGCNQGCGLTFRKVVGQRSRIFAKGCPNYERDRKARADNYERTKRKVTARPGAGQLEIRALDAERPRVKICQVCYNLPHARPEGGVCVDQRWARGSRGVVIVKGCGLPHQSSDELPNHAMLREMPENVEKRW